MKKNYSFLNLAIENLSIIKAEKANTRIAINKIHSQLKKNPNYINLCKSRLEAYEALLSSLELEAKETRKFIRKAKTFVGPFPIGEAC